MEPKFYHQIYVVLLMLVSFSCNSKAEMLRVYENAVNLRSLDFGYPDNITEPLDVIWLFNHSIRLKLNEFNLNGHDGDFVLISELPLENQAYFKKNNGTNATDETYLDQLAEAIYTDQALLLSWNAKKTYEAVNDKGTFVLFHSEPKNQTWTSPFKGFDIEVVNYDFAITTTTSTTPDPYVDPKGEETYITKFLNCKAPLKFLRELKDFKEKIAQIATQFCKQTKNVPCTEKGDISYEEVNVPGSSQGTYAGLHWCDHTWSSYATCVEVTFSILRTDNEGNYIFPSHQLEKMWDEKSHELVKHGYCPYSPPKPTVDLNTVVWIAFFLGIIISLTAILGATWIKRTLTLVENRHSAINQSKERIKEFKEEKPRYMPHYDKNNPIYNVMFSNPTYRDDYPSNDYRHVQDTEYDVDERAAISPKKHSTDNPEFQDNQPHVYAYDNTVFEQEEEEEEQHVPDPNTDHDDDGDRLIMSESDNRGSLSDTEI